MSAPIASNGIVIHVWSGPRSLSTATMYSFGQRSDTHVVDEPLYGHWLRKNPHIFRPYREELLQVQNCDGNQVMADLHASVNSSGKPVVMAKQIAKQFVDIDKAHLHADNARHVFLIRNPIDMLDGWQRRSEVHQEIPCLDALSLPQLVDIFSEVRSKGMHEPIVIDAEILQNHPKEVLTILCSKLGIPFEESMLRWEAGPKPSMDGLWASHWYASAHKSTGFYEERSNAAVHRYQNLVQDIDLIREAMPFYDILRRRAVGVNSLNPGSSITVPDFSKDLATLSEGAENDGVIIDHGLKMSKFQLGDPRNEHLFAWIGDRLLPREQAKVSAFDSAVQGGDAVWEGLRIYDNKVFKLEEHLHRLVESAKAMAFANVPSLAYIRRAIGLTLKANNMSHNTHIRLSLTRGPKLTSSMNPAFNVFGCTLIVLPEFKTVGDMTTYDNKRGIRLVTACNRRNPAQCVDSKIHHCNLINNILPKIQANVAGAADALMLDLEGFVSETNATNVFLVKDGVVYTPPADSCLPGITRRTVILLCQKLGIPVYDSRRLSLTEFYAGDEVFTSGTMGELTPVYEIDGRFIGPPVEYSAFSASSSIPPRPVLATLSEAYAALTATEGIPIDSLFSS